MIRSVSWAFIACAVFGCSDSAPRDDCDPNPRPDELGTICGFQNPEDVEAIPSLGVLVVSEMRHGPDGPGGALAYVDLRGDPSAAKRLWPNPSAGSIEQAAPYWLDPFCELEPHADLFSPHGISARIAIGRESVQLAVVSHEPREAIEVFGLERSGDSLQATWLGCVPFPPDSVGNDVVWGKHDSLLATRYQPTRKQPRAAFYSVLSGLGFDTGEVLRKRPGHAWETLDNSSGASPNGLVEAPTGVVYFTQTGNGTITALRADQAVEVPIGGHPDNLSWSRSGTILAVTHTEGLGFLRCALGRRPCRTAWSLVAIDPDNLETRELYRADGDALGAAASVAEIDGRYYFGSVFDDRIGVASTAIGDPDGKRRP